MSNTAKRITISEPARAVNRIRNQIRIGITFFILVLLATVTLGWIWTTTHQPPPLRAASRVVLATAALAGIFGLVKIWRST